MTDVHQHADRSDIPQTLHELLRWRALHQPHRLAYSFVSDGATSAVELTYGELDRKAQAIAGLLQQTTAIGERVVLLYPPGIEYIAAFFGCLYAGAIAVPAYPPALNRSRTRIQSIVADAQPTAVLATARIISKMQRQSDDLLSLAALRWLATDDLPDDAALDWTPPALAPERIAFLQYTSGSTSTPKGVMLTHRNLLENVRQIERCFEHTPDSRGVIWLPPYHDMGLIGGILQPLYAGFPVTLMSPMTFLQSPIRWLQAIDHVRATTSGGPNFAYDLCASRITPEQAATLDLSSWDVAFVGAEPIQPQTLDRFAAVFAPCGFRREAFYPCYGLAEATLMIAGGGKAAPPVIQAVHADALEQQPTSASAQTRTRRLVGCGQPIGGHQIAIVDPQTGQRCSPGTIGEIWVAGACVAQGYWNRPAETAQIFRATIAGSDDSPFLRTGDLGCIHQGELFVTGRIKDLIIIRGQNYYPQDIEQTVGLSHPVLRPNAGAAFSIEVDGQERLVVVQEVERQARGTPPDELVAAIRRSVVEHHDLHVHAVALLKTGQIPKTSSGKIQRFACRAAFLAGTLDLFAIDTLPGASLQADAASTSRETLGALAPEERQPALEAYLQRQIARALRVDPSQVTTTRSISGFGLDSLMAVELQHAIESALDVVLPMTSFLRDATIVQLAGVLLDTIAEESDAAPIRAAATGSTQHPLSYGQRALWFVCQLDPDSTAYTIAHAVRVRSDLHGAALRRALEHLVARHAALRTTFPAPHGEPLQQVHEQLAPAFSIEPLPRDRSALDERLEIEAQRPFDLQRGPLLRVCLFSESDQEHVLLFVVHHIIADLWSLSLLIRELGALYAAETTGQAAALAPLTLQYTDYVTFQAELLASSAGRALRDYWLHQLADAPLVLDLPTDYPRPAIQTSNGATFPLRLDEALTRQLKALAQRSETTLYTLLLAAFQILLARYTGQDDLLVGSPTTGRSRRAFAELVGYLVNPVVLRANLAHDPPFLTFLAQVRQTVLGALDHQDYPLPLLVEQLQPARDASRSPLVQVMFVFQNEPLHGDGGLAMIAVGAEDGPIDLGGLTVEPLLLRQQAAQFDLTLTLTESRDALVGAWQYNTALFRPATIERMSGHFRTLLSQIVAQPEQRIAHLPLLTPSEQREIAGWNATEIAAFKGLCLHHLLEAQAARTPDAIAVVADSPERIERHLTYRELNQRANQLARYLRSLGVQPEAPIGVCLDRSLELVIGLIGVLKAGGAYLPLDPAYPAERLRFMLDDSQVSVVLTQQRLLHPEDTRLPDCSARVVCLDADWPQIAGEPEDAPDVDLTPDNLAYIIYTSGSTGRPKGVMNTHQGICNRLLWMQQEYRLSAADRVLQKTPFSFDVSVWELFWPLLTGARLVMAQPGGHLDPAYLIDVIKRQQITTLHFVPAMLHVFLEQPDASTCTSVRRIMCSGEALPFELQERCFARLDAALHNLYGPTEAAVDVTFWRCNPHDQRRSVPIGSPVANTQIYLLDAHMQPVPVGVPGELHIGGVQLARGYLGRPALTAERFVPCPFAATPGGRLYKTGDRARYHEDGSIEFLGRSDHQIKLRGYRIELGEIEAVLRQHEAVREAVVLLRDERLVAYVVGNEDAGRPLGMAPAWHPPGT
ncbi:MAG TPA: amino acid adenylation domain-containing protein, partial [Herpetosiphonaceae bacterium]